MIPDSLFAIHWTDRREPEYTGIVRDAGTRAPMIWCTEADARHYIALAHLDVEQDCTVVEYRRVQ